MWDLFFERYAVFLLVFARISGMLLFNPFFGRKNVPVIIKGGLALLLSISVAPLIPGDIETDSVVVLMVCAAKELLIGFFTGFILQLFMSAALMAGDVIDLQLGLSMARAYDPQSNTSASLSGNFLNLLFTLLFFLSNGHLTFMKMMFYSFQVLPPEPGLFGSEAWSYVASLFGSVLILALKLALPVLGIEILSEAGVGILMRMVPQINMFAVGLQLKLLVGLALFATVIPPLCGLMDDFTGEMFARIEQGIRLLG